MRIFVLLLTQTFAHFCFVFLLPEAHKKQASRSVKHPHKQRNSVCTAYYNDITINNACQNMQNGIV